MGRQSVGYCSGPQKSAFHPCLGLGRSSLAVNIRKHWSSQGDCCFSGRDQKDSQKIQRKAQNHPRQSLLPGLKKILLRKEK